MAGPGTRRARRQRKLEHHRRPGLLLALTALLGALVLTGCFALGRPSPAHRRLLREAVGTLRPTGDRPIAPLTNQTLTPRDVLYCLLRRNTRLRVARLDQRVRKAQAQAVVLLENPELRVMNLTGGSPTKDTAGSR